MPTSKATEEPKKEAKNYEVEKYVFRGGQLVSFKLKGKEDFVAIQDVLDHVKNDSACHCEIDGKNKKLIVRNSGSGDYLTVEGETKALEQLIPLMVTKPRKNDKEGNPLPDEYEPNKLVHNA
ncbi:MAG TPA: hypothetical protein VL854_03675 [Nitrososphaeraceae archaeon]|nr:hypothetical protein [Nitrososphaeraceae archaeon]